MWKFNFFVILLISLSSFANTKVKMETSMGNIVVELFDDKAPVTVRNFIQYVNEGHYDGLIFHRVIPTFVIQGGGHTPDMREVTTRTAIINESNSGVSNLRGTIAMARESDPNSATAQFYFNVVDNPRLDYRSDELPGYCAFGRVILGLDILDSIRLVKTQNVGKYPDVPVKPILIISSKVLSN
jgi:cyclophilin family peptidyl-prolyl cis-trans isomerase